jgi:uncharacterized membrane protein HdeD (DUF308 family)
MMSLSQNWWMMILRGVLAIMFGVAAFVWPGLTWFSLVVLFGAYVLVDGVIALVAGLQNVGDSPRWWVFLLEGIVGIAAGITAFLWPGLTAYVLLMVIASWAIITGILEIAAAIRLRREITNEWALALGGLLSIGLGVLLFMRPVLGGLALVWTIGAYALIFGVLLIALGFRLRSANVPAKPVRKTSKTKTMRPSTSTR